MGFTTLKMLSVAMVMEETFVKLYVFACAKCTALMPYSITYLSDPAKNGGYSLFLSEELHQDWLGKENSH